MFELTAEGPLPQQRLRWSMPDGAELTLGRSVQSDLPVPWDSQISRKHALLRNTADQLHLQRVPGARNAIYHAGEVVERLSLSAGQRFVIGQTVFSISESKWSGDSNHTPPLEELTFDESLLSRIRYRDADKRIEVLSRLPDVIWGSRTDAEYGERLVSLLLAGIQHAEAVAIVRIDEQDEISVLHWDRRRETRGEVAPSRRLVHDAIRRAGKTVLHVWSGHTPNRSGGDSGPRYTEASEFNWSFCTPLSSSESGRGRIGLYIAGRQLTAFEPGNTLVSDDANLRADVKFTELVADIVSAVQRLKKLERQQTGLRQFFAPAILSALGDDLDTDVLEPRECPVTVLFCDLRGFSQKAEDAADDLAGLLDRVSRALSVMTEQIQRFGGVTGDFQGDAALGFWGWPFPSDEAPCDACRAALQIREAFLQASRQPQHPLADFEVGIGIAHGVAVAGKIGTSDQVKVTVFGPVVNLASRLEAMTRQLHVPILVDEATAGIVREKMSAEQARIRKLARVLPYGLETPLVVSELLPSEANLPDLTQAHLEQYDGSVDAFIQGRWDDAFRMLHAMPPGDRAQDFLMSLIAQHNRQPPANWDGTIRLPSK
mgnify:FL=1